MNKNTIIEINQKEIDSITGGFEFSKKGFEELWSNIGATAGIKATEARNWLEENTKGAAISFASGAASVLIPVLIFITCHGRKVVDGAKKIQ